jgi:hypothetical protein
VIDIDKAVEAVRARRPLWILGVKYIPEGSSMTNGDLVRQLQKIHDAVATATAHFKAEAEMNAALHMNPTVRPAPLAVAIEAARDDLERLIGDLMDGSR